MKNSYKFDYNLSNSGFKIISQPHRFIRGHRELYNGIIITTASGPAIFNGYIYLRGSVKDFDNLDVANTLGRFEISKYVTALLFFQKDYQKNIKEK